MQVLRLCVAAMAVLTAASQGRAADPIQADVLLKSGILLDGSGQPGYVGDVAITGSRIVGVGRFDVASAKQTIDCAGLVVCPGFIDLHNHSDSQIISPEMRSNMNFVL